MAKDAVAISNLILARFEEAALGEYAMASMDRELGHAMSPIAAVAAVRIRETVESDPLATGISRSPADGASVFALDGQPCISIANRIGFRGEPAVTLSVSVDGNCLLLADFDPLDRTMVTAHCPTGREADLFDFLDRIRASVPETRLRQGDLPIQTRYADEIALIEADGGLPGEICRLLILGMYRMRATGVLADAAKEIPAIVERQKAGGFVWGERFLSFQDLDRRSCAVPMPGHSAAFFQNVDACADTNSFLVAVGKREILVWGIDRERDDVHETVEAATRGVEGLPEPDLRARIAGKDMTLREPCDASQVVPLLHYGLRSMARAFGNLQETLEDDGTEVGTDFERFRRGWDPELDGPASP